MTHFLENIIVETNRALVPRQNGAFLDKMVRFMKDIPLTMV